MRLDWTKEALEGFSNIQSKHFSADETREYKKQLVKLIEDRIFLMGTSIPVNNPDWEGSFKIIVDKFIVYYSYSKDYKICYIEYFKHFRQLR